MTDEELNELSESALDRELARTDHVWSSALADLLIVPDDLVERTTEDVRMALLDRSTLAAASDLLSVGWHTARLLFTNRPSNRSTP
jgi:hypothetical protein